MYWIRIGYAMHLVPGGIKNMVLWCVSPSPGAVDKPVDKQHQSSPLSRQTMVPSLLISNIRVMIAIAIIITFATIVIIVNN